MPDVTQPVAEALAEVRDRTGPPPEPTPEQKSLCADGECGGCIICYGPGIPVFGPSTVIALADEVDRLSALLGTAGEDLSLLRHEHDEGEDDEEPWAGEGTTQPDRLALTNADVANLDRDRCEGCRKGHYSLPGGKVSNYPCTTEGCACWFCNGSSTSAHARRASGEGTAPQVPADTCRGGGTAHPFEPGVDIDSEVELPDPTWCNVCGEARSVTRAAPQVPAERGVLRRTETMPIPVAGTDKVMDHWSAVDCHVFVPPGTRVRVVAADGAPPEETER